jgi:hypothetical protein
VYFAMVMKAYIFKGKSKKPNWWKNFLAGSLRIADTLPSNAFAVNRILRDKYNATIKYDYSMINIDGWHTAWIEFEDEKEYTRFMLTWL